MIIVNKKTPEAHPWITPEEQQHIVDTLVIAAPQTANNTVYSWKELLSFKATWGIISARFFIDPVCWLFITWLPTFFKEQFAFDIKQIGAFAWFPYLMAAIGGLLGGWYSSSQIRKGVKPVVARKKAITVGCVIMLLSLVAIVLLLESLKDDPAIAIGLISLTLFGFQFLINNIQTLPSDYFNGKNVGVVAGMSGTSAVLGVLITTWLVPVLTKTGYHSFFVMGALLVPFAWGSMRVLTRKTAITN